VKSSEKSHKEFKEGIDRALKNYRSTIRGRKLESVQERFGKGRKRGSSGRAGFSSPGIGDPTKKGTPMKGREGKH